jgi:hypothetical protein
MLSNYSSSEADAFLGVSILSSSSSRIMTGYASAAWGVSSAYACVEPITAAAASEPLLASSSSLSCLSYVD